jgi:predicted phosphodiesterase
MKYFAAVFLIAALWAQQPPASPKPAVVLPDFFVVGSDPQFGFFTKNHDFVEETANFEFFIASMNRLKPKFVVITGDLTNTPDDKQIAEFHRIARNLLPSIRLYNVAGNHDVQDVPTPLTLSEYRKNWGPDYYTFDWEKTRGIVINSSLIQHPANVQLEADTQERWLRAELAKAKSEGMRVIIFQHIPYFLEKVDEQEQYFNIRSDARAAYLRLFHDFGVRHIFAGHYHRNTESHDGDIDMVTTGAIGMPLGTSSSGFRIVMLDRLDHRFVSLANIPNQVQADPR